MPLQLPLGIALSDSFSFDNYLTGDNAVAWGICRAQTTSQGEQQVMLWGESGVGKTHLLQASCSLAATLDLAASYLPLKVMKQYGAEILQGLDQLSLVCLDDVDQVAGDAEWEVGLFNLINTCRQSGTRLLMSMNNHPGHCHVELPDLVSRLGWGPVIQVQSLSDEGKLDWLRQAAERRGLKMPEDVAQYLLRHCPRDMSYLGQLVDRLDNASLIAQRKLTLPFVREVLAADQL